MRIVHAMAAVGFLLWAPAVFAGKPVPKGKAKKPVKAVAVDCTALVQSLNGTLATSVVEGLGQKGIKLLAGPSSHYTKIFVNEWTQAVDANDGTYAAITYKVTGNVHSHDALAKVLFAAMRTDELVVSDGQSYTLDLRPLDKLDDAVKLAGELFSSGSLGPPAKDGSLMKKMGRVHGNPAKRVFYGGYTEVKFNNTEWGASLIIIVDSEYGEITLLPHGDLFKAFVTSAGNWD